MPQVTKMADILIILIVIQSVAQIDSAILSRNKNITSSSIHSYLVPEMAIDGDPRRDPDFCFCCAFTAIGDDNPWYELDLGKHHTVQRIHVERGKTTAYNECADGEYGDYCEYECHCDGDPCNKTTGVCPSGRCLPGYEGKTCNNISDCGSLTKLPNGQVTTSSDSLYGATATYTCNEGFYLSGSSTRTCLDTGIWEGNQPTCSLKDCGKDLSSAVTFGSGTLTSQGTTTYQSTATVNCDSGYTSTTITITCQANGAWSTATCSIKDCDQDPSSAVTSGSASLTQGGTTTYQSTATVNCITGYASTTYSITCQANGQWSTATCSRKDCGQDPSSAVAFGSASLTAGDRTTHQSTANVTCITGYASPTTTLTCQANGQWSAAICSKEGPPDDDGDSTIVVIVAVIVSIVVVASIVAAVVVVTLRKRNTTDKRQTAKIPQSSEAHVDETLENHHTAFEFTELTDLMTNGEVMAWMTANDFIEFKQNFRKYTGKDLLGLSKEDVKSICGAADGIRLFNRMRQRTLTDMGPLRISEGDLNTHYADLDATTRDRVPYENIELNEAHMYSSLNYQA